MSTSTVRRAVARVLKGAVALSVGIGGTALAQTAGDGAAGVQIEEVRVTVRVQLDPAGNIVGTPEVTATGGPEGTRRAVESSTLRAIRRSAPLQNLPPEKYEGEKGWNTLVLNFDPSEFAL